MAPKAINKNGAHVLVRRTYNPMCLSHNFMTVFVLTFLAIY